MTSATAGAAAAVLDKRKREARRPEAAERVALAAGGRDLPARHRGASAAGVPSLVMQDEAEAAAFAGREREPARRREIGLARKLGHDRGQPRGI